MAEVWPYFSVIYQSADFVVWGGRLRPLGQSYWIRIRYFTGSSIGLAVNEKACPRVTVVNPMLRRRWEDPEEPIPHNYGEFVDGEGPELCLFDPEIDEWHSRMAIADTIVPWTIGWLACFEGWLATGEWTGGGRHPKVR